MGTSINLNCQLQPNAGTIHQKCGESWPWQAGDGDNDEHLVNSFIDGKSC